MRHACFLMLLLCRPLLAFTAGTDTTHALRSLAAILKENDTYSILYSMDARFPNGDKDHMAGTLFFNAKARYYYNHCDQYTMLYTARWFYQADHREKTITLIDLSKEDKRTRNDREQNIFRNGTLSAFLDTVLLKKGSVRSLSYEGDVCNIHMAFPPKNNIEKAEFTYDTLARIPISCYMQTLHPMDIKGNKNIEVSTNYTRFRNHIDTTITTDMLFTYSKSKLTLKRYNNYKLISKI